jgi:hypothetical protein
VDAIFRRKEGGRRNSGASFSAIKNAENIAVFVSGPDLHSQSFMKWEDLLPILWIYGAEVAGIGIAVFWVLVLPFYPLSSG